MSQIPATTKALTLAPCAPLLAFLGTSLAFQPAAAVLCIGAAALGLAALNYRRLRAHRRILVRTHPCKEAQELLRALKNRHHLDIPPNAFISDAYNSPAYEAPVDALVVTENWLKTFAANPDAATAIVLHELAHRREIKPRVRCLISLTYATWPVLLVLSMFYYITSPSMNANSSAATTHLALALATSSLAYGLGVVLRSLASHALELRADASVLDLGYGPALAKRFRSHQNPRGPQLAVLQNICNLIRAHPSPDKRAAALERAMDTRTRSLPALAVGKRE